MSISGIGQSLSRILATTPGKVAAVAVGGGLIAATTFGISKLLDRGPSSVADAKDGAADVGTKAFVCERGVSGRQWCREETGMDYAMESSASGSESSMLSSEDSYGY